MRASTIESSGTLLKAAQSAPVAVLPFGVPRADWIASLVNRAEAHV